MADDQTRSKLNPSEVSSLLDEVTSDAISPSNRPSVSLFVSLSLSLSLPPFAVLAHVATVTTAYFLAKLWCSF